MAHLSQWIERQHHVTKPCQPLAAALVWLITLAIGTVSHLEQDARKRSGPMARTYRFAEMTAPGWLSYTIFSMRYAPRLSEPVVRTWSGERSGILRKD